MTGNVMCACGCGEPTPLITKTDKRKGWVKGQPAKYIAGHQQQMMKEKRGSLLPAILQKSDAITETDIERMRSMDDIEAADIYDARVIVIEDSTRWTFIELGLICMEVTRRELWKRIVDPKTGRYFHSRDAWIAGRLRVSQRSAYSAMEVLKVKDVPVSDLREMPRVNAVRLAGLSTQVQRDPTIIQAAKGSEKGFVQVINNRYPDQHQEPRRAVLATLEDSARKEMEECFEVVRFVYEVEKRTDVFSNLFAYFMDGPCEREGYQNVSNREAFDMARKRGVA